tara:strand:- start:3457 stop:3726 length:270 start_codon:yes stop_codon:yes gene_type:complete
MKFAIVNTSRFVTETKPNVTPKLAKLRTICSNPIHKDKHFCIIFWNELKSFNEKVAELEYSINNDNFIFKNPECDVPENAYLEECRIYD